MIPYVHVAIPDPAFASKWKNYKCSIQVLAYYNLAV